MTPVYQTRFGNDGNCAQACIASILECPLEDAFDPMQSYLNGADWRCKFQQWLYWQGLGFVEISFGSGLIMPSTFYIIGGDSPRDGVERGHYVVGHGGRIVHDPHPSNAGLTVYKECIFFLHLFD